MSASTRFAPHFQQAFALAEKGRGRVEPNPLVGALVLDKNRVIGRGCHRAYGGDHAEVEALRSAKGRGDTLLVTLEPCSTTGKTPPCVEAILKSKISTVVIGASDPFPGHRGKGARVLAKNGIRVLRVDFQKEWEKQNRSFLRFLKNKRPWVIAKWAMTLDGKAATSSGDSKWISSPVSREDVWRLRGRCEAVLTGVGTVLHDDPLLTAKGFRALASPAMRVIMDSKLRTPFQAKVVMDRSAPTVIVAGARSSATMRKKMIERGTAVIQVSKTSKRPSPKRVLSWLSKKGVRRVLLEAGPGILGSFLEERCVDQVVIYLAPKITGGAESFSPVAGKGVSLMNRSLPVGEWTWKASGPDLKITGFLQ